MVDTGSASCILGPMPSSSASLTQAAIRRELHFFSLYRVLEAALLCLVVFSPVGVWLGGLPRHPAMAAAVAAVYLLSACLLFFARRHGHVRPMVLAGIALTAVLAALAWRALGPVGDGRPGSGQGAAGPRDRLGSLLVVQLFGLLLSPISWTHHWVWLVPLMLWLLTGPWRDRPGARVLGWGWLALTLVGVPWLLSFAQPTIWEIGDPGDPGLDRARATIRRRRPRGGARRSGLSYRSASASLI